MQSGTEAIQPPAHRDGGTVMKREMLRGHNGGIQCGRVIDMTDTLWTEFDFSSAEGSEPLRTHTSADTEICIH